jgi:hypothetical protein
MTWQRLEGSGVSADLNPGLEARIADPLWMLARQWQVGEFTGEDAARPVEIRARAAWHRLGELRLGAGAPQPLDLDGAPLEARVEAEPVWDGPARVRLAAEAGLQLLRLAGAGDDLASRLRERWPLPLPAADGLDPRGRLELELLARRSFDAIALGNALDRGEAPDEGIAGVVDGWHAAYRSLFVEPPAPRAPAWDAERLEYRFALAAPGFASGTRLQARGYPGGRLDWSAFDVDPAAAAPPPDALEQRIETVPIPLRYAGMPAPRWWAFEDRAVYWGDVEGGPEDLARYLVASFATLYGDDWFLIPLDLRRGVLAQVTAVEVLDSFGRTHRIAATAALDHERVGPARTWRWFELSGDPAPARGAAPHLLVPPVLPTHEASEPLEEILLMRDEVSNLAWAVERVIEGASGRRLFRGREAPPPAPAAPAPGAWGYRLGTSMPPGFVPLVPVRIDSATNPAMRLQRGRLATAEGSVGARGLILEPSRRLLLHEEEVPASGIRVTRGFQMCRGTDGSVHVWVGRQKRPGRQASGAGLVHDVVDVASDSRPTGPAR